MKEKEVSKEAILEVAKLNPEVESMLRKYSPDSFDKAIKTEPSNDDHFIAASEISDSVNPQFLKRRVSGDYKNKGFYLGCSKSKEPWKVVVDDMGRQVLIPESLEIKDDATVVPDIIDKSVQRIITSSDDYFNELTSDDIRGR